MYSFLKSKVKLLISKKILFKHELFFRRIYGFFYKGKRRQCNVCSTSLSSFITLKKKDLLCPFCGSLSRNRRLWKLLNDNNHIKGNVLHFSPSRNLFRKFNEVKDINYFSSDFENEFIANYRFNITNIENPEDYFDLIICYHILEHIEDDTKAMSELYRVLKSDGKAVIQTPFKEGEIYEDESITLHEERNKHFGQQDHVRVYSVNGLKKRLEKVGFKVSVKSFDFNKEGLYLGFKSPEIILIAEK